MTKNKNKKVSVTLLSFLFVTTTINIECWDFRLPKINFGLIGAFWGIASLCRFTPDLYIKPKDEGYAFVVERRINALKFILENPSENQLASFKNELICHYNEILKKRGYLSRIVEKDIPHQPWALLDEEINQYLKELDFWKSFVSNKFLINPENAKPMLDKIESLLNDLTSIRERFQSYSSYQLECSLARQEEYMYTMQQIAWTLFFFYLANKQA